MQPRHADDADLLRAHRAGDPHAFARLYDRYDRRCFQFIRRTLGAAHAAAAEDLHQETWVSISKNASAFDPRKANFRAWLFTIARRKAEKLVAAVEALPLTQRETFLMFANAGLSLKEIADATGVAVETTRSRLRYARATLRQALASEVAAYG